AMADRIVFHFDGNNQDADDIAAIAVAALLAKAGGIESKTTFLYGNNLSEPNDGPARQQAMDGSADFARSLGIASYDYQDGILGTTDLLVDMLRSGEQILLIEGGPMEAVYRALDAVEPQYHSNLTLLSHSEWNEDRAVTTRETDGVEDGQIAARTWDDIAEDFPLVTQIEIADQNGGDHNTSGFYNRNWDWMDETTDPMIAEAREKMMAARNSSIGSQNKQNDPSDAGMLFYALTGEERGTPEDAQAFIEGSTLFSTPATPIATPGPIAAPTPLTVGLFFTDGAGEAAIADLASDGAIDLAELSGRPVTVQASILPGEGPIGSVVIDAGSLGEETDESAPFALAGPASDSGDPGAVPSAGSYPILVTAFSGPDGTGSVVGRQVFTLAVTGEDDDDNGNGDDDNNNDGPIELAIALVNASTDSVIGAIQDGGSLSIANGLADSLSIAAMSDDPRVGSVTLQLGTGPVQIENQAPYALFGDMGGDYEPGTIPLGSNRLTIRTWSGENGQGRLLSEEVLTFDLAIENRPPVAADDSLTLDAGAEERIDVRLNDSDPDGDPLTVTAVSASTGLEASVAENGEVRVASTSEDGGTGRVVYTVEDGRGGSAQAEIAVTVTPPPADDPADDPGPVAIAIALVDAADEAVIEAIEEGETLSVSAEQAAALSIAALVDDPRVNSVTLQLGNGPVQVESHTPYALFGDIGGDYEAGPIPAGRNQLTIAAWSGENGEGAMLATQTIAFTLDVAPPMISNRDPTPMDDALSLAYLGAEIIDPLTNDSDLDQDALTITALTPSQGLTASRVDGGVRVAAVPDFTGPGTVTYRVADGRGGTAEAVIAVTVAEPEAARIGLVLIDAATDTALGPIQQGSVITVPSGSTDALSIEAVTEDGRVESIALQFDDGQVQIENMAPFALFGNTGRDFLPGQIGPGAHNLTVTAFTGDGASGLDLGTTAVLFEIVEEDLPPVLVAASFVLASDAPSRSLRITAAELGLDPEGEALVIDSVADPINGSVMITADRSAFVYIPDPGFAGDETFEFALSEADLAGSARTNGAVTVGVEPPPEEPAAMPDLAFSLHFTDGAQEEVTPLEKGTSIRSSSFENRPITVVATTEDDFEGSITMELVGVTSRVDSTAPFALHADEGDQLMEGMTLDPGVYELAYTAFSEPSAAGSVVGEGSFTFEVASPLFDVAVFSTRFLFSRRSVEVSDGGTLDASQLHSRGTLSVGFVPAEDAPAIGSVELTYEGNVEMQNYVPYAYFGGFGSDFLGGRIFQEGAHEVDVRVFSDRDGQGMLIDSFTFDFSVT
ncbi:MAG: Ig-like domain-containing protein, partial [Pseudomonadota bacterium]